MATLSIVAAFAVVGAVVGAVVTFLFQVKPGDGSGE
jgi:hypothetical protein